MVRNPGVPVLGHDFGPLHQPKLPKIWKRRQMVQNFPEKVSEIPEIVEFPKSEQFNRKF